MHEKNIYELLAKHWVLCPEVITYKIDWNESYLKESSLWEKRFYELIMENKKDSGFFTDELFKKLIHFSKEFITAKQTISIDNIKSNNEDDPFSELIKEWALSKEFIEAINDKMHQSLSKIEKVRTHWDFSAYNVFPNWIIDVEDSHINYKWYDTLALLFHIYRFPIKQKSERERTYTFTQEQLLYGLKELSIWINLLDKDIFWSLFLYRWMRAVQKMDETPLLKEYRYKLFEKIGMMYLEWKDIKHYVIETFNKR